MPSCSSPLDWLPEGLPHITWNVIACDDGCPAEPISSDLFAQIAEAEHYPRHAT